MPDANGEYYATDSEGVRLPFDPALDASRLYYEAHVTIPPLTNAQIAEIDALCAARDWRRSTFVMEKDGSIPNAFVSMRSASRQDIIDRTASMVQQLVQLGYTVLRWKVEDTVVDSNRGDQLLPGGTLLANPPRVGIYEEPSPPGVVVAKRQDF